jgi:hypothetical protein
VLYCWYGRQRYVLTSAAQTFKDRISSPFGFQHLTHANRHQFKMFEQASSEDLTSDPGAMRTSQHSSNGSLGASVDSLQFTNFSSESLDAQGSQSQSAASFCSPPSSPRNVRELQEQALRPALRLSRSVESFSQPGLTPRNHRHSQSVFAPPRLTALSPLAVIEDVGEDYFTQDRSVPSGRTRSKRESGVWDTFSLEAAVVEPHLPGFSDDSAFFGHALTTPDDSAIQAMTTSFSPSLDDVAEEPERFAHPRVAPQPPSRSPATPKSPRFNSSIFTGRRSSITKSRSRGISQTSPRSYSQKTCQARPVSGSSDTLGSSDLARRGSDRRSSATRDQLNTWRALEDSWEDDIDYIYEHAMEADCEFDWDRASDDEADEFERGSRGGNPATMQGARQSSAALYGAFQPAVRHPSRDFRFSLLVPNVPGLTPTSAASISTMSTGLRTPYESCHRSSVDGNGGFMVSPSLLIPEEYKEQQEHTYEDLLEAYADSERHYTVLDPRHSGTSSARSRRSSYDSSLVSSAQSSGLWSFPLRRSASSAGSVPELVHSRRTRQDINFNLVVDQLAESVDSIAHLDEDKDGDDITPPGRVLKNRTFFPVEEEEPTQSTDRMLSIQDEMKSSLELARHGSQRNSRSSGSGVLQSSLNIARNGSHRSSQSSARYHKQAMSDGTAKLLITAAPPTAQAIKPRGRAATASQAKPAMLSLFPAPPRYSPNPNRM